MEAKDTVMKEDAMWEVVKEHEKACAESSAPLESWKYIPFRVKILCDRQAEISFKAGWEAREKAPLDKEDRCDMCYQQGMQKVVDFAFKSIDDEPEFPSDMPDELWIEINGSREITTIAMRNSVRLTKENIKGCLQAKLRESKYK